MMIVQGQAYKKQFKFNSKHLLLMNLYGPGDNFNLKNSHVIPAIIKKIHLAKKNIKPFFIALPRLLNFDKIKISYFKILKNLTIEVR